MFSLPKVHPLKLYSRFAHFFEDNPIAQNLLVKQLERFQLKVDATSNGIEAIESKNHCVVRDPCALTVLARMGSSRAGTLQRCSLRSSLVLSIGSTDNLYMLISGTDMPICDGVEATKRIRVLENKRRVTVALPSEKV
jgi:CheY-like chemotaxis protein